MAKAAKKTRGRPPADPVWPGRYYGDLKVIRKVNTPAGASGGQRYQFECTAWVKRNGQLVRCGNKITFPIFYVRRKHEAPKSHCGCQQRKADEPYTKRSWYSMHSRCYYPKHIAWEYYGGRGITVCWEWHRDNPEGWENFKRDMGPRPQGLSIDRIDNDKGYEPGNCRWATPTEQSSNQRRYQ